MKNHEKNEHLSNLDIGNKAVIGELKTDRDMKRRLLDIGLISGTRVKCLQKSRSGDISAYMIRGAVIALRRETAEQIEISGCAI